MDKKKLWIFTELFFPEETSTSYILTKIANSLVDKYKIEVVCGEPVYDTYISKNSNIDLHNDILVDRIKGFKVNKNNLFSRILRFIYLSVSMSFRLLLKVKKNDKVLIVTNPAPLILFSSIIKKIKNYELIILVHDVFPENTIPSGVIGSKFSLNYKFLKILFDKAYSFADKLIVLGRDMKEIISNKVLRFNPSPSIYIIENWGDTKGIIPLNKNESRLVEKKNNAKINFLYAGNLGRLQGLMQFLEIIKDIKNDLVHFTFRGEGALKNEMVEFVEKNNLKNVSFGPSYRRDEQLEILNNCDITLVLLAEGMKGLGVPSKAYNIMAAGKPILFIGDAESEISLLIKEMKIGLSFNFSEKQRIIKYLENITLSEIEIYNSMGEISRKLAEEKFSEYIILKKYFDTI